MIKNYLKIAVRNILKNKVYSAISVLGLGLGVAAAIVIVLFSRYELTFDQWHENSENTFMVYKERVTPNGVQPTYDTWVPLLDQMLMDFPEVENGTRLFLNSSTIISVREQTFSEDVYYADPGYFDVFDFPLAAGNNEKPFTNLNSVVLSEEIATKLFGDADPIGKEIILDHATTYIVSGVMKEYPPNAFVSNGIVVQIESHPDYQDFARSWGGSFLFTFVLLPDGSDPTALESKFPNFITNIWDEETQARTNFKLLPLHDSYDTFIGDSSDSYILMYIALGIIIIASINFMNLSTARSLERAKEIGLRKVMGAQRKQLVFQFLSEALIMTTASLILGIFLAEMVIPVVNSMFSMSLALQYIGNLEGLLVLIGFGIALGLLSGSYPAFILSNFKILESVKGSVTKTPSRFNVRNILVITQFTISIILITGTLIITDQINFMQTTDLAFNKENLVVIPISESDFEDRDNAQQKIDAFRSELAAHSSIQSVATSRHVPGRWSGSNAFVRPEGSIDNPLRMRYTYMDAGFFETFEIDLLQGPGFLPDTEGDQRESVIINEAAMKALGWDNIEDKAVVLGSSGNNKVNVVGLIRDFNYESLREEVQPILHFHRVPTNGTHRYATIRIIGNSDIQGTLDFIKTKWANLDADREFDYFFVDQDMQQMYANEDRLLNMVGVFSILSIFVSCLGLFGLSSYIIDRRKKEIGIRKVLGASSFAISTQISNGFIKLVLIALVLATPITFMLMSTWLEDFAFKITIGPGVFLLTLAMSISIAWITVTFKSARAAIANPVDSIREE